MTRESVRKTKRVLLWITGGVLIILAVLHVFLPKLVDSERVREKIKAGISQRLAGSVDFQKMEVSLFPRPEILIGRARFSFPGKAEGTVGELRIYPRVLPLLAGKVRIGSIVIEGPDVSLTVPRKKEKPHFSVREIEEKISSILNVLSSNVPEARIVIGGGSIRISDPDRLLFLCEKTKARIVLPPGEAGVTLTCNSDIARSISLGLRFDQEAFKGTGTLELSGVKPKLIVQHLFPDAAGHLGDSEGDLRLSLRVHGHGNSEGSVEGALPVLTLLTKNEKIPIRGIGLKGAFALTVDKAEMTVKELKLEYPRLALNGTLSLNTASHSVSLEVSGSEIDVPSLRTVSLSLAGGVPIVQDIFAYVRGGKVPSISVRSQGAALEDLGKTENIVIEGLMQRGEIFVPGPKLYFKEVNGDCVISGGVLEGKNIEGDIGTSQVRDGKLRVGLKGRNAPLHIDAAVKADLAETRNILRRLITDEPLLREIDLIQAIHGEARGRVILGESTASLKPRIDLSAVSFTAEYQRLPFPLVIKGGQFSYDERRIGIKNIGGTLGKSSFAALSGELRQGDSPYLDLPSGKVSIYLDEVYPWLTSFETLKRPLEDVRSLGGVINLDTLKVQGPLLKPKEWRFALAGKVEDITADWAFLPGPAFLKRGAISADEEKISLAHVRADVLDASVTLSVSRQGYLGGNLKTDLTFQGEMGPRSLQWAAGLADLPRQLSLAEPIAVQQARLAVHEDATSFQGAWRMQKGPAVTADVLKQSKRLVINKVTVRDASSDAALSVDLRERALKITFAGGLSSETLEKLITEKELPGGKITGDFQLEIQREKPFLFTSHGKLHAENISFSLKQDLPLTIENLTMNGDGNRLTVESSSLNLDNNHLSLQGNVKYVPDGLVIDMDLSTDRIEWAKITKTMEAAGKGEQKAHKTTWDIPVGGTVRLRANAFVYDKYTLTPFDADIAVHRNDVAIALTRSALCGISSAGTLNVRPDGLSLDLQLTADHQQMESTLECLLGQDLKITGTFDLNIRVNGEGKKETLRDSLQGTVVFAAKDGRIYRDLLLLKIFDFIEINQIVRGLPDMRREGLAYRSITTKADLKGVTLEVKEAVLDGSSVKIAAEGSADLKTEKLNFTVLVVPFRRIDAIIRNIPVIGRILGKSFLSVPLDVTGDFSDPKVAYHPATAVGSGLLGIIKRTLETPVKLFEPLLPSTDTTKK